MFSLVKTILTFKTKEDALRFHILAISTEEGLALSSADIKTAVEIYNNGYNKDLFRDCVDKGYFKTEQTVRNSVARMTKKGLLIKTRGNRTVASKFLPDSNNDLIFNYQVRYENQNV